MNNFMFFYIVEAVEGARLNLLVIHWFFSYQLS